MNAVLGLNGVTAILSKGYDIVGLISFPRLGYFNS
jgi:hypothetical protein